MYSSFTRIVAYFKNRKFNIIKSFKYDEFKNFRLWDMPSYVYITHSAKRITKHNSL